MNSTLTIVIPAFNEATRIEKTLDRVLNFVEQQGWNVEILVVDDGSKDRTAEIVRTYAARTPIVRLLSNSGNRGKGFSVRNGALNASGDVVLFTDADLSAPIEEAVKLLEAIDRGADIAIGSRWLRSDLQTRRQSLARQVLGRAFNGLLRILLDLDFKDTQCGFKAFRIEAARTLFFHQRIEGWGFDPELLFLAQKSGFKIAEVPVVWAHDDRTRINPLLDGSRMVADMLRIRCYDLTGRYANQVPQRTAAAAVGEQRRRI